MPELYREHRTDKKIYFYDRISEDYIIFNGKDYTTMKTDTFFEIMKRPYSYSFILVRIDKRNNIYNCKKQYEEYIQGSKHIKKITKGKINLFRTGSVSNTALSLFYKSNLKNNLNMEDVQEYELKYLENGGGVRIGEEYKGIGYKYDINSFYPSLYISKIIKIPYRAGTLKTIDNINDIKYVKHGIYNVKIDVQNDKLFTERDNNIYTHYELNWAKKLGYTMESQGQHLIYNKDDLISMYDLFNKFIDLVYPLKKEHKIIKLILNSLWGALVSKCGGNISIKGTIDYIDNYADRIKSDILSIHPINKDIFKATLYAKNIFYRSQYARLNPFLMGFARCKLHKDIYKIGHEHIKYSHTDSMILDIKLDKQLKISDKLGDYKYEGMSENCHIINKNQYIFE
jgi:hypothetical protein